jgi:hypothetical protein
VHPIPGPIILHNHNAFSDVSSGVGLGIVVGEYWCAWTFFEDWHSQGRHIRWAEAVTFELLAQTLLVLHGHDFHFTCHGDNTGAVKGWWKGASKTLPFGSRTTSPSPQERIYTHNTCLASTTLPAHHREESSDPPAEFFPLSPSPMLSSPTRDATDASAWPLGHHPPPQTPQATTGCRTPRLPQHTA